MISSASRLSIWEDDALTGCPEESDDKTTFDSCVFVGTGVEVFEAVMVGVTVQVGVIVEVSPVVGDRVTVGVGMVV